MAELACVALLEKSAHAFRLGMEMQGNQAYTEFTGVLRQDLAALSPARIGAVLPILKLCLAAQERADYLYLADLLEYELKPTLADQTDTPAPL